MAVKNNLKLIFSYLKLNIQKEYQYKTSFFTQIFLMVLNDLLMIIQWVVIFNIIDNIGGYGFQEVLMLWAISAGGYGVAHVFFAGAWNIKDMIYDGKLDVYLTQPKSVLLNVCCSTTQISAVGDIIYSYVVLFIIRAPWLWFLQLIPAMILAGLTYVAVYVCYVSLAFYVKGGDGLAHAVEGTIIKASNYPPKIFGGVTKWLFFTLIPTFFYTFVPVQYMFLSYNFVWILIELGITIFWVVMAFILFNAGLKKYNSGSVMSGRT